MTFPAITNGEVAQIHQNRQFSFVLKSKNIKAGAGTPNFQHKVQFKARESSIITGNLVV